MGSPHNITSFLDLQTPSGWDPRVMAVMAGALLVTYTAYTICGTGVVTVNDSVREWVDRPATGGIVVGGVLFGVGWGMSGLCPGPAFVAAGVGLRDIVLATGGYLGGRNYGERESVDESWKGLVFAGVFVVSRLIFQRFGKDNDGRLEKVNNARNKVGNSFRKEKRI
jgi:hypothetical protein